MLRQLTIFVVLNLIVQRPSLAQTDTTTSDRYNNKEMG
jgi:hypothetical protein